MLIGIAVAARSPESRLLGVTADEAGQVDQWIHLVETEIDINVDYASYMARSIMPFNQDVSTRVSQVFSHA